MAIPAGKIALAGSERHRPHSHTHKGSAPADRLIGITVMVRRRPDAPSLPSLADWHETPFNQRRVLTRTEYARLHGADPQDLDKVTHFAQAHGLKTTESHAGRRSVVLEGKPAQFNAAFGIELQEYEAHQAHR